MCDEVKVGLARTGQLHCFEHEGFVPDIVCFGKGLGGGLPVAAMVGPAAILDHATAFAMQTLHGNPIAMAAGKAVLETIHDEKLIDNAREVGAHLRSWIGAAQSESTSPWPIFVVAAWRLASNSTTRSRAPRHRPSIAPSN